MGLSVPQLAKLTGLCSETVREIERGKGNPKLQSIDLLAEGLKTESWRLLKELEEELPPDSEAVETAEEALDRALLVAGKDPKLRRRLMRSLVRSLQGLKEADWRDLNETERRFLGLLKGEGGEVEKTAEELASMIGKSPRSFWYAVTALEGSWIIVTHRRGKGKGCAYRLLEVEGTELIPAPNDRDGQRSRYHCEAG